MYTARITFMSQRGTIFQMGQEISDFRFFLLSQKDKDKFLKGKIGKELTPKETKPPKKYTAPKGSSPSHYGYGPEPGYSQSSYIPSHYIAHDDVIDNPPHHDFDGFGGGDGGGAGASDSWSSDSGGGGDGGGSD